MHHKRAMYEIFVLKIARKIGRKIYNEMLVDRYKTHSVCYKYIIHYKNCCTDNFYGNIL